MRISNRVRLAGLACLFSALLSVSTSHGAGAELTRVSLPSGPGSIEGLGKSFVPAISSGTASYEIRIEVPPGSAGFGPSLSLGYNGGNGVSELGMGWKLGGLVRVRRRTEDGLPRFTVEDRFELDGIGAPCDLVEISPGVYRAVEERGAFARVKRDLASDGWEVRDKSGTVHRLGGKGFEESENGHVTAYLLREQRDLHGHVISFEWDTSSGYGLLQSVVWNDFDPSVRNRVELSYEGRPDPVDRRSAGIRQKIGKRLSGVSVRHGGKLVRRYELGYLPTGAHSLLESVTLVGSDESTALPPVSFEYTAPSFAADGQVTSMQSPPGYTPANPDVDIADLNGDGLPDLLLTQPGAFRSYVNQDGSAWLTGLNWSSTESPSVALGAPGVRLADIDGDGAVDLVVKSGVADFRYFPGESASSFAAPIQISPVPSFDFDDPDVQLADMDGDRRADGVISTVSGWAIAYNRGGKDWDAPQMIATIDPKQKLRLSDGHTSLCDVNGDQVLDVCYLTSGSLAYWVGRGRGAFEAAELAQGVPQFDASSPWELRDLNGDGWADLVHVGVNVVSYSLATSPGHFEPTRTLGGVPQKGPSTALRFADMNGSGTTDVVWVDVSGSQENAWRYLELFPDGRAGLLRKIENGLGAVTTIEYGAAAQEAAAARASAKPWTTRINVALPVVKRVRVESGLGDPAQLTEYAYRDGAYDVEARTFAAFAGGEEVSKGDDFTPTLITASTFDLGLEHRVSRGNVLSAETRDEKGVLFARTQYVYEVVTVAKSVDGRAVEYAYKSAETKLAVEGAELSKARETRTEWEQDEYGNVIVERAWGEVVGGDPLAGDDERITLFTHANNTTDWVIGRIATQEVQGGSAERVSLTRTYYDGPSFQGLPLGQISRGDVTRVERWVGPLPSDFVVESASAFDADGNVKESRDGRGGSRRFAWDPVDRTSLTEESIDLGSRRLTAVVEPDGATGKPLAVTGFDGQITKLSYDALGRLTAIVRPGDTSSAPTLAYEYQVSAPLSRVITRARVWSDRDDVEHSESLTDGLGRNRGRLIRDDAERWVLEGVTLLDTRGNPRKTLRPRFVTEAEHDAPPLLEDAIGAEEWRDAAGRPIKRRTPRGLTSRTVHVPLGSQYWDGAANDPTSPYEHTPLVRMNDGLGRLVSVSQTLGGELLTEHYRYDAAGNLLSKTDPEGHVSKFGYDGRGLRLSVDDPDAGKHALKYDATGNLVEHHRPDGTIGRDAFDLAGRRVSEDWDGDGKPEIALVYDEDPAHPADESYRGRLVSFSEPSGTTTHAYDARGNIVRVRQTIEGRAFETTTEYDSQDRAFLQGYPDGSSLRIHRNARGLVSAYGQAVEIAIDADGRETQRVFNTGVLELFGYDEDRQPYASRVKRPDGSTLQDLEWKRDGAGNVVSVKDKRPDVDPSFDRSEIYAYDNLYRLTSATGTWGQTTWGYSPSGNLTQKKSTLPEENAGEIAFGKGAGPHAMTGYMGRNLAYDAFGRLTDDGVRKYVWDASSNLARVEGRSGVSVESTFGRDHERRVKLERDEDGVERKTLFLSPWSEVRDGELVRYIVHGGQRIARLEPRTGAVDAGAPAPFEVPRWPFALLLLLPLGIALRELSRARPRLARVPALALLVMVGCSRDGDPGPRSLPEGTVLTLGADDALLFYDGLGSLTEVVRATGESLASTAFHPYGRTRYDSASETDKYTGAPRDSSVELDQMQTRWYVPELGVWSCADPLSWSDPTKKVGMPFAAGNPYAYAGDQPTTATDRTGECPWCIIILAAAASSWAANAEYDRQVKTGESNVMKMVGVSVVAGESVVLGAKLPLFLGEGMGPTVLAGGLRNSAVGLAGYGAESLITGQPADPGYAAKSAAWDFGAGMFGGMLSHAGAGTASYPEGAGWQLAADATDMVVSQTLGGIKTAALPAPKASGASRAAPQLPRLRAEPIARPAPAAATLNESNFTGYVMGNLKNQGYLP